MPRRVRTPAARVGIAVGTLAAVVALFIILSGGDDNGRAPSGGNDNGRTSSQAQPPKAHRASKRRPRKPKVPAIERIVVRDGKPVGGVRRLEYERGERARFSVRSDVAEEIHVHGFDIAKDVPAGGSVRFGFPADLEGVFEVELEHSHVQIAELRVEP
jgi:hypothetical protein